MDALDALREALHRDDPTGCGVLHRPNVPDFGYAVWRFLEAWHRLREEGRREFGPDGAVLLRQVVRWAPGELHLPPLPDAWLPWLSRAGLDYNAAGVLTAEPFCPAWLTADRLDRVAGIDGPPRAARPAEGTPAESCLRDLGGPAGTPRGQAPPAYVEWQSLAQKEAAWRVLTAPPGSTTLVVLPTGTGKSLLFQLAARVRGGLTVVVVPTVALAIDQCENGRRLVPDLAPVYYAARDQPEAAVQAIERKQTRLVFTSPEACVSGRLRGVLQRAASEGWLDNLVLDEVHLVETWGAYFRVDFQLLAGVRRSWLDHPGGARLRTLLLTATLTPESSEDLRTLFAPAAGAPWQELVCQRLRPEMVYFDRWFDADADRDAAVVEALWRLPRPAILYTTEVEHARTWHRRLTEEVGFIRVGCFHGETSASARRELLDGWRRNELDLMVATSAFGLGVDKQDVRAVVHACFPEDMNRYYQEVGRGGRDGWTALCLLLPTRQDYEVAQGLGPKFMTPLLLQQRWEAMWHPANRRATNSGEYVWKVNPAAIRAGLLGSRTGGENVRWNKRLLLQLHRAGLLRLRDVEYVYPDNENDDPQEWIEVDLKFQPDSPNVGADVETQRQEELTEAGRGLDFVRTYLGGQHCIASVLRRLYGPATQRTCGGCRSSRVARTPPRACPSLTWLRPADPQLPARVTLVAGWPDPTTGEAQEARFLTLLRRCQGEGQVRRFAAAPEDVAALLMLLDRVWLGLSPHQRLPYRLDALEQPQPFDVLPGERLLAFHRTDVVAAAAGLHGGAEVVHCLTAIVPYQQLRYALEAQGHTEVGFFSTPEQWLQR